MPDGRPAPGVAVCVPARNEAERLPRLLATLARQEGFGPDRPLPVVVLVNNSRDGTAARVRDALPGWPSLAVEIVEADYPAADAHVGTARRQALDIGAARLADDPDGILLSTDADARLPPGWVAANRAALRNADMVGGHLLIDGEGEAAPDLLALHETIELYWAAVRAIEDRLDPPPHDPAPRHGDHTGASLALRASLYREVGGLPPLRQGEDNALVRIVREAGGRLRHCPHVTVLVSDRPDGRAEGGMAVEMVRRAEAARRPDGYELPAPSHWTSLVRRRARLRAAWRDGAAEAEWLLGDLGLASSDVARIDPAGCPNDIAFVERASGLLEARDPAPPGLPLGQALAAFGEAP